MMRDGKYGGKLKSGNTKNVGRPRKLPQLDKLLEAVLGDEKNGITAAEQILKALKTKAARGDTKAAEILLDRAYGKAKQVTENYNINRKVTPPIEWVDAEIVDAEDVDAEDVVDAENVDEENANTK